MAYRLSPNKPINFMFRLTAPEKLKLMRAAEAQGLTMSDYIRQRCLMGTEATEEAQSDPEGQINPI